MSLHKARKNSCILIKFFNLFVYYIVNLYSALHFTSPEYVFDRLSPSWNNLGKKDQLSR